MSASYTFSVSLQHAPAVQFLVKKHDLRFSRTSSSFNQFYCTVTGDDMKAFNAFQSDWEQLEQELKNEVPEKRPNWFDSLKSFFFD